MIPTRSSVLLFVATLLTVALAAPPAQNTSSEHAKPESYVDYSLPELQQAVPETHGLRPDPNQNQLAFVLTRVGEVTEGLLRKMPNLLSHEQVLQTQHDPHAFSHEEALQGRHVQEFNYLILSHQTQSNERTLDEYRTDLQDRRIEPADENPGNPHNRGFTYAWVLFFPSNIPKSRFRYLGQQKIDKQETFVVAFAQNPDLVRSPGEVVFQGKWIPVFHQGIAWIDRSTFRIVRLRMDLLAPIPRIHLQRLTAELHFGDTRVSASGLRLWLPRKVEITSELYDQISSEIHLYSNYRLYTAQTKIVPAAP